MYKAIQNLRVNHVTYIKGKEYEKDSLPKGYEKCFIEVKGKGYVETSSRDIQAENRSNKGNGRSKRTRNTNRGKKSSKNRS